MKWLIGLALGLCISVAQAQTPVGPPNQILCNNIATLAVGPTTITQIVAAATGARVFICGWHVTNTGAAGTFTLSTGTGTNCGTNTATLIPAMNVTNTAPSSDHVDYAQLQTAQSVALCVTPSVATIAVLVWYNQF